MESRKVISTTLFAILLFFYGCGQGGDVSEKSSSNSLTSAGSTITWEAPTLNADGTSLTDLAGYKIYLGSSSGYYSSRTDIGMPATCQTVNGVTECTFTAEVSTGQRYFCAVTAYDIDGNESDFSNEVEVSISVN